MKKLYKILLFSLLVLFVYGCETPILTHTTVAPARDHLDISSGSFVYSLPETTLHIKVKAEKTVYKQGPYHRYAERYLGIKEKFPESSVKWKVTNIEISSYKGIDPDHYYIIESTGNFSTNAMAMTEAGLIMTPDPGIYKNKPTLSGMISERPERLYFTDLSVKGNIKRKVEQVRDVSESDTALFIEGPVFLGNERTPKTTEEKAREVADFLTKLKNQRLELLGEPYDIYLDGGGFEYIMEEMKFLENKYTELFTGITYSEVYEASFEITPDEEISGKPEVLFRFSDENGILPATDLTGRPVVIKFSSEKKTASLTPLELKPFVSQDEERQPSVPLYYRIPDIVTAKIADGRNILGQKKLLVYQFGKLVHLPSQFLIKKE